MPFCEECGNKVTDVAKFCLNCGTKTKEVTKIVKKKIKKKSAPNVHISPPQEEQTAININEKDTEYLKEFFTQPGTSFNPLDNHFVFGPDYAKGFFGLGSICLLVPVLIMVLEGGDGEPGLGPIFWDSWDQWWWLMGTSLLMGGIGIIIGIQALLRDPEKAREWKEMSPEPLFRRLDRAQRIVADSSFEGLGINRSAKPSEGGVIRNPAYSYGPHLDFTDLIFGKVDKGGIGKGAGYYKICDDFVDGGLYTREYDMMVIQFTQNQILVYKCIFDILEMTKRLEESYEWNYKHVVGINISGDDTEKKLGASISVTGTKYMVISAASGDKIEIILGAETNELVDGEKKKSHLGGEDKIFEIANAAVKNVREAIRDKAG